MSRWHTIVVADRGRKLHTFDYVPRVQDQEQNVEQPRLAWHHRAVVDNPTNNPIGPAAEALLRPGMSPEEFARLAANRAGYRRYLPQTFNHVPLEDISDRLGIADGFNPTGQTLAVILDALRLASLSSVELADLNAVVTAYGAMIGKLDSLPVAQRRHAEPTLYKLISERCAIG
jgi:hypothetical protein